MHYNKHAIEGVSTALAVVVVVVIIIAAGVGVYLLTTSSPASSTSSTTSSLSTSSTTSLSTTASKTTTKTTTSTTTTSTTTSLSLSSVTFAANQPAALASAAFPAQVASGLGFYNNYHLTVNTVPTAGSLPALTALISGQAQLAMVGSNVGLAAMANGTGVRYVYMSLPFAPAAVYALSGSGISSPKDLQGKTVGMSFGGEDYELWPAFAQLAGINASQVNLVNLGDSQLIPELVAGKVDATVQFTTSYENYVAAAATVGKTLVAIQWSDYMTLYGSGILTTNSFISQHPDVIRAFLAGYTYGLEYMLSNPSNATTIITKAVPTADFNSTMSRIQAYVQLKLAGPAVQGQPYGWMTDSGWNDTISISQQYLGISGGLTPSGVYTDDFIASTSSTTT